MINCSNTLRVFFQEKQNRTSNFYVLQKMFIKTFQKRCGGFSTKSSVGNKAKERILKRVLQENKARQIFQKRTFLTPCKHTFVCVSRGKKCSFFGKFGVLFFSCNTLFKIHPFDILPTVFCIRCFFIVVFQQHQVNLVQLQMCLDYLTFEPQSTLKICLQKKLNSIKLFKYRISFNKHHVK